MAASDVSTLNTRDFERYHFIAEKRDDPADGADEARSGFAAGPIHRLGPLNREDRGGQGIGQQLGRRPSRDAFEQLIVSPVDLDFARIDALLSGESGSGLVAARNRRT